MIPGQGFEPRFSGPEPDVLPLHHPGLKPNTTGVHFGLQIDLVAVVIYTKSSDCLRLTIVFLQTCQKLIFFPLIFQVEPGM